MESKILLLKTECKKYLLPQLADIIEGYFADPVVVMSEYCQAILTGKIEVLKYLGDKYNPHIEDNEDHNPGRLYNRALGSGHMECARYLESKGRNVEADYHFLANNSHDSARIARLTARWDKTKFVNEEFAFIGQDVVEFFHVVYQRFGREYDFSTTLERAIPENALSIIHFILTVVKIHSYSPDDNEDVISPMVSLLTDLSRLSYRLCTCSKSIVYENWDQCQSCIRKIFDSYHIQAKIWSHNREYYITSEDLLVQIDKVDNKTSLIIRGRAQDKMIVPPSMEDHTRIAKTIGKHGEFSYAFAAQVWKENPAYHITTETKTRFILDDKPDAIFVMGKLNDKGVLIPLEEHDIPYIEALGLTPSDPSSRICK